MTIEALPRPLFLALVALSVVLTLMLYVVGGVLQILNLPLGLIASSLLVFGVAGVFFPASLNLRPLRFTGLDRASGPAIALGALLGVVNLPLANFLVGWLSQFVSEESLEAARLISRLVLQSDSTTRLLIVVGASVAAPLGEELFFRGWLQTALSRRLSAATSVIVSAILFSAIHGLVLNALPLVELAVLFGLLRLWTGSLWPAIAMHAAHNFGSLAVLLFSPDPAAALDAPLDLAGFAPVAAGSLVLTLITLGFVKRLPQAPEPDDLPIDVSVPTYVPVLQPALNFAAVAMALIVATALSLFVFRASLPGHELKVPGVPEFIRE